MLWTNSICSFIIFFIFTLGAGKIKETTRNKRYVKAQVHVWHNLFGIDSLNFCCIGNFYREPNSTVTDSFYYPTEFVYYETSHLDFGTSDRYASFPFHRIS